MRIATWNVNGLRARFDFLVHWLAARQPDVVGLQELKLETAKFPHEELGELGYRAAVHGQKSWNGVAVLARDEPELVRRGLPGEEEQGARLVEARVGGLAFVSVYCPNGKSVGHEDYGRKLEWMGSLAAWLGERAAGPAIVGGDFNVCPAPIDSWDEAGHRGRIFHTDAERERFRAILECGYVDLYRDLHPDRQEFSWWDYRAGAFHRGWGLRIDFLLGSPEVRQRVRSAEIDREYRKKKEGLTASDHAPVIMELD